MDAYQQSHRYMRPPPPPPPQPQPPPGPGVDHYHQHNHYFQQQQPRPAVPPQGHQWYSNQFQYQAPSSHSPSPPPPSQWAPPPSSSSYPPPPPPPPFPAPHYPLPPRPHVQPSPHVSQCYPQPNQDWGNPNWSHQYQSWDYTAHNNTQDWAARAKEWANARAAMENQHMQSQFTSVGRPEEQSWFSGQCPQSADYHYKDTTQQSIPTSSYQQFPVPSASSQQPAVVYQQENAYVSSGPPSYGPDVHLLYSGRDGASARDASAGFPCQESSCSSPSVHRQEVSSRYSSVTGKEETADQKEHTYGSLSMPISAQEGQPFAYGNQAADTPTDLRDHPLDFASRFNHDHDFQIQSGYAAYHESAATVRAVDSSAVVPSVNSWTPPVTPSVVYPPIPPVLPAGPQHDPTISMASVPGPTAPQFGRIPGPGFPPAISSASTFGVGAGATLHPTTALPGDAYGVSGVPERPKKAPVPNWLKEEIIKNKAAFTKSLPEHPKEETPSVEDEDFHKLPVKGDQADSKSIDSSRSTEEEDDDEDYMEAAKTAAINQEIKRILTEVLLKVTDELFDEIATKVLCEDDLSIEGINNAVGSNRKVSPPPPAVPAPKASAKVLVPVKAKDSETAGASEKTSSSSPGDVLGLGNYASDDDDGDDEIQSSSMPSSRNNVVRQSSMNKLSEYIHDTAENGSYVKPEELNRLQANPENDLNKTSTPSSENNKSGTITKLSENRVDKHAYSSNSFSGERDNENNVSGKFLDGNDGTVSNQAVREKADSELPGTDASGNSQITETRMKSVNNDRHESRRSSSGKDSGKEVGICSGADDMGNRNHRRHEERHSRKGKAEDRNGSRDRKRDEGSKPEEKAKDSKSRKKSTDDVEDGKDADRRHGAPAKEGIDKRRELSKEEDTLRHKHSIDSSRHKKMRSSSISSRGRNSRDNAVSHAHDSCDESSDDSKRKRHSSNHKSSPSPVRSKTRQVLRLPHSKHSQRRHSPYSSLETSRRRRSRSRSPVRRQR